MRLFAVIAVVFCDSPPKAEDLRSMSSKIDLNAACSVEVSDAS